MAAEPAVVLVAKKKRSSPSHPSRVLAPGSFYSSEVESGSGRKHIATFDPRVLLTKLSAGKSSHEYLAGEYVFSQGEPADAAFYVQSGRVKLTVVSKTAKKPWSPSPARQLFRRGLPGWQPLRMATASAEQRSTIIRWRKR